MVYSAGLIPFRENETTGEIEFFVGHPGGPYQTAKDIWYFLKGGVERHESWDEAAIREFKEETGLPMDDCESSMLIDLGTTQQNSYKRVVAFGIHYPNIDPNKCVSNFCEDGIHREIDRYAWMTYRDLKPLTHPTHLQFYEQLLEMCGIDPKDLENK